MTSTTNKKKMNEKKQKKRTRKKAFFVFLYSLFSKMRFAQELKFMNHGYAPKSGDPDFLKLPSEFENFRYPMQLYHFLAQQVSWKNKRALEVSSGNGGGADYIYDKFNPEVLIGVDLAPGSVKLSNRLYAREGLSYQLGDALALPFDDNSIDIVINVESSLNYPDPEKFLSEVNRVLKPGGHFIYADYFRKARLNLIEKSLSSLAFKQKKKENLSKNIIRSLELSEANKQALLKMHIPFFLREVFSQFIFSGQYYEREKARFETGEKKYFSFFLQKMK